MIIQKMHFYILRKKEKILVFDFFFFFSYLNLLRIIKKE